MVVNTILRHIEDFLSLAVGELTSILELTAERVEAAHEHESLTVLFAQRRRGKRDRVVRPGKMVFTLNDIATQWPDPLRQLFAMRDELRSATDLYFAVVNSPSLYLEVQFLTLAQALESFHRGTRTATVLASEHYEVVKAQVEALLLNPELALPDNARATLCGKLKHWNELTLRHRVKDVVNESWPDVRDVIGRKADFVNAVVRARNYLTHRDPELRASMADPRALIRLKRRLQFVVQLSLLRAIGVPEPILQRHTRAMAKEIASSQIV